MVVEARFRIAHAGCFTELVTGPAHMVHLTADGRTGVSVLHAGSEEQLRGILERMERRLDGSAIVERDGTNALIRAGLCPDGVVSTVHAHGCAILWPLTYAEGVESYAILAPSRQRLDALVERLGELGKVDLLRVSTVAPTSLATAVPMGDLTSDLTPRQLSILRKAIDAGYYASPRHVSTDALARAFGISRSTLEEHLRKAERGVLEAFATVLAQNPGLFAGASRGIGRPRRATRARAQAGT